jgi:hypothetical protein
MMPRNYYQLQQMKTQNMKRKRVPRKYNTEKIGKFESSDQRVLKKVLTNMQVV